MCPPCIARSETGRPAQATDRGRLPFQGRPCRPSNSRGRQRPWCVVIRPTLLGLIGPLLVLVPFTMAGQAAAREASYPLACYYARTELDLHEHCARRDGTRLQIAPAHVRRLRFRGGLAEAAIAGIGWLWVRRDGLALPVFLLDNGPDPFQQGLVRGWHEGKVAFYDRRLRLVLATSYDWSYPFNARGEALVCTGCRSDGRLPATMTGGRWGVIDQQGRLLAGLSESEDMYMQ